MADASSGKWPEWWDWDLEFTSHLLKRMIDRAFSEVDLRAMMEIASGLREDVEAGRWVIETKHGGDDWEVIVDPDQLDQLLVVITAYPVSET